MTQDQTDPPPPTDEIPPRFSDLGLGEDICRGVAELGFEKPTPIQAQAIPEIVRGADVLGIAQTGTGKTAAFVLPIIERLQKPGGPRALVISPTRELAQQIHEAVLAMGRCRNIQAAIIIGGESYRTQLESLKAEPQFVVGTPGRLLDQIDRGQLKTKQVEVVVLDEADRLLDMGFLPQIQDILGTLPTTRQSLLFSATMPPGIGRLAQAVLRDPVQVSVGIAHTAVDRCEQELYMVADHEKPTLLKYIIRNDTGPVLIFTRTRRRADEVYRVLRDAELSVTVLHGDLRQEARVKAISGFREGKYQILVATDVASRGLDVDCIERVVNYDTPSTMEDYLHRIGRTARAEQEGHASTFSSLDDSKVLRMIEAGMGQKIPLTVVPRSELNAFAREEIAREYARAETKKAKTGKPRARAQAKPTTSRPSAKPASSPATDQPSNDRNEPQDDSPRRSRRRRRSRRSTPRESKS